MKIAKIFRNGQSQAVRLPKEFRFSGNDVYIRKLGDAVILLPKRAPWSTLISSLEQFTEDCFSGPRTQSSEQRREGL